MTNRIGDVENKNLPCLLSYHDDPKRKLKYDIEAVLLSDDENWVGINQILSNRLVEFFFNERELDAIVSDFDSVQRDDGQQHLAFGIHCVDGLLFEVNGDIYVLQLPDEFQAVQRVPGKPANRFSDDHVDVPGMALVDHAVKLVTLA